jgi:hypothetical protein
MDREQIHGQLLEVFVSDVQAPVPLEAVLGTQKQGGPKSNQMSPFPEQISEGTKLFRVDIAFPKATQSQKVCQPEGIVAIIGMFEASILFIAGRMSQMYPVPVFLKPIDQPVPVIRRFDDDALQIGPIGLKKTQNHFKVIGQSVAHQSLPTFIRNSTIGVV